jgi:signal transduction histidine kinase
MSEPLPAAGRAERPDIRRRGSRSAPATSDLQTFHLWVCVLPAAVMAVLGAATVAFFVAGSHATTTVRLTLVAATVGALLVLLAAAYAANAATRQVHQRLAALRSLTTRSADDLQRLVDSVQRGERPAPREAAPLPAEGSEPFSLLTHDLQRGQQAAHEAVLQVAATPAGGVPDQRVEVFVNLARRMQSLVHREIQLLDDLEAQVEDPSLLKGLFTVDHLATRMRRQSESLAVLGGAASRRQWSRPVAIHEVLRAAVAEVENYSRVKVVPPIDGALPGNAVADVIHLVAELIENATKFSAPGTQVLLRAQAVTAGLAIEVEDRGLGMLPADQRRMNDLLADPSRINISELLRDGRIGLFVVSALARRHHIKVQLQNNIYGGVQAVVVLSRGLIDAGSRSREPLQQPELRPATAPSPATSRGVPPPLPTRVPAPTRSNGADHGRGTGGLHATDRRQSGPGVAAASDRSAAVPQAEWDSSQAHGWPSAAPTSAGPTSAAPTSATADIPPPRTADQSERPALPQRRVQGHLAPQLRTGPTARHDEPTADHIPGLMGAFQSGVSRAEEEDGDGHPGRA